ncbi:MAG: leucine dehydrogenase [Proteobacteria bacterium]|nr:leucine dehydrogenase [Pseudomonadota bacterium]
MALIIEEVKEQGFEKILVAKDSSTGLSAIIAIHNTRLGPACGGIRMLPYASQQEAMTDVLRLAKGMSYKSALAGINFGGGKSVIIGNPDQKSKKLFHSFGEFVEKFEGKYIAAKDMNIESVDLGLVKEKTRHVLGVEGELGTSGDPSPVTALGVFRALEATAESLTGSKNIKGLKVAVQGIGHVGYSLAALITEAGGEVWVTDTNLKTVEKAKAELKAKFVELENIYDLDCDIFSPCARGAILNSVTIPRLKCKAIVGAANNQLATPEDGIRLHERGILYAPDYAINSGGIINIFIEYQGYDRTKALKKTEAIYLTMKEVFQRSKATHKPTFEVADLLAEERLYGKK